MGRLAMLASDWSVEKYASNVTEVGMLEAMLERKDERVDELIQAQGVRWGLARNSIMVCWDWLRRTTSLGWDWLEMTS